MLVVLVNIGECDQRALSWVHPLWQAQMSAEADAFIGIPGGFGTLEELLEMVTWQQLGLHTKPVGIYNMCGYFDHLLDFFDHAAEEVSLSWHPPRLAAAATLYGYMHTAARNHFCCLKTRLAMAMTTDVCNAHG